MRKYLLLSGTVFFALTGMAAAADLPYRAAPPVFTQLPPVFSWTGFYAGVNAGYAFDNTTRATTYGSDAINQSIVNAGIVPGAVKINNDGFTGGAQIGYNYQFGPGAGVVVGIEADAAYTDLKQTTAYNDGAGNITRLRTGLDYLGTVRGRLGYSFGQFMIYGTGGFAYGGTTQSTNIYYGTTYPTYSGSNDSTQTGYAYGGGIEYALPTSTFLNFARSSAVTLKVEYLHYDLGHNTITAYNTAGGGDAFSTRVHNDGNLIRAGLNYKFGSY